MRKALTTPERRHIVRGLGHRPQMLLNGPTCSPEPQKKNKGLFTESSGEQSSREHTGANRLQNKAFAREVRVNETDKVHLNRHRKFI